MKGKLRPEVSYFETSRLLEETVVLKLVGPHPVLQHGGQLVLVGFAPSRLLLFQCFHLKRAVCKHSFQLLPTILMVRGDGSFFDILCLGLGFLFFLPSLALGEVWRKSKRDS